MASANRKQVTATESTEPMATGYLEIIKAVGPYIAQIAGHAIPAFTSKSEASKADPAVAKQIEELQTAVTQNAQAIHLLAEKMQETIGGLHIAAEEARNKLQSYRTMLFMSLGFSAISLITCVALLLR